MALTLDATVGGANANAYATRARVIAILEENPFAAAFLALPGATQDINIVYASLLFDVEFDWIGEAASTTQAMEWPRRNATVLSRIVTTVPSNIIPIEIERGVAEYANYLSLQTELPAESAGLKSVAFPGGLKVDFKDSTVRGTNAIPDIVRDLVAKFVSTSAGKATLYELSRA